LGQSGDTIKAIEEYGLKQHQMVKSNKKIVAGTEYYDTNNDLQVRGSENEIRKLLMQTIPTLQGASSALPAY
jgi:predicted ATP-dependent Lon-type protease